MTEIKIVERELKSLFFFAMERQDFLFSCTLDWKQIIFLKKLAKYMHC